MVQELREKIAKLLTDDCVNEEGNCPQPINTQCKYCITDQILALVEEAGYVKPSDMLPKLTLDDALKYWQKKSLPCCTDIFAGTYMARKQSGGK